MLSIRRRTGLALVASLTVSGFLVGSRGLHSAQAGHIIGPATYQRDFTIQQFAAEAAHIGALRGVNTAAYLHRFTALARQRARWVTSATSRPTPCGRPMAPICWW